MSLMDLQGLQEPVNLLGKRSHLSISGHICPLNSTLSVLHLSCR